MNLKTVYTQVNFKLISYLVNLITIIYILKNPDTEDICDENIKKTQEAEKTETKPSLFCFLNI